MIGRRALLGLIPAFVGAGVLSGCVSPAAAEPQQPPAPPQPGQGGPMGPSDPFAGRKKLLVWADIQSGFHHDSINHAMAMVERLGRESGAYVAFLRSDSQLITKTPITGTGERYSGRPVNARNLDYFDAIFFLGSGEGTLSPQQKADLLSFVRDDGKGFIGGHASIVGFYNWPEFGDMIGAFMDREYPVRPTQLIVEDPSFPGAMSFGSERFTFSDQYPTLKAPYLKERVHTIVRLDPSQLSPEDLARRPDGDIPVAWARNYGRGRVYYNTFGHPDGSWDDPRVQQMYLGGIKWALGLENATVQHQT